MSAVFNTNNNSNRQHPGEDEETVEATEEAEQAPVEQAAEDQPVSEEEVVQVLINYILFYKLKLTDLT